jgi:hypothetical protein
MELWIRTQKGLDIFKVDNVQLMGCDIYTYTADGNRTLGEYDSHDRALQVLDEIHRLLVPQINDLMRKVQEKDVSPKGIYNVYAIENTVTGQVDIREIQTLVYQMPKE